MATLTEVAKKQKSTGGKKPATKSRKPVAGKPQRAVKTSFPLEKVAALWNEGKSIEEIAKATGYYRKEAGDPTSGFRARLNVFRSKGILKIGFRSKPAKSSKPGADKKGAAA